jgi:hypothetical protein
LEKAEGKMTGKNAHGNACKHTKTGWILEIYSKLTTIYS